MPPPSPPEHPDEPTPAKRPTTWRDVHLWQIQWVRDILAVLAVIGVIYLGYLTSVVTVPLLLALLLAYLFEPLVRAMGARLRLGREAAAWVIILGAALLVVVPSILALGFGAVQGIRAARGTAQNVDWLLKSVEQPDDAVLRATSPGGAWSGLRDWIVEQDARRQEAERLHREDEERRIAAEQRRIAEDLRLSAIKSRVAPGDRAWPWDDPELVVSPSGVRERVWDAGLPPPVADPADTEATPPPKAGLLYEGVMWGITWVRDNAEQLGKKALTTGADALSLVVSGVTALGMTLFGGFLTAFFFYFFCTGYGEVLRFWEGLIPERRKGRVLDLLRQMDRVIAGFVRGRLTICAVLVVFYTLSYGAIGVPGWLLLGPAVGLLSLLPYVSGLGTPVAMLLMWLDTSGTWQDAWWWTIGAPIGVNLLAQFLDDYILTPRIQGKSTDMDVPTILFASIAGGALMGVYGLLIAIPLAACLKILVREFVWPRVRQWAHGERNDFIPLSRD
ncbi:MAG: AI-2E family transporter [Phycisphaeraceae bacterium]|nr:MAG: AI-2E family transporter [Phycisphaeraceae bacterium]